MTAPALSVSTSESMVCARCDGSMVLTPDAIGRLRKRCPKCDGVATPRRHPDDAQLPQALVTIKVATLPPIEPGQLRCQLCAHGVQGSARFCPRCGTARRREHNRHAAAKAKRPPLIWTCKCGNTGPRARGRARRVRCPACEPVGTPTARVYKPRPCSFDGCTVHFTPTGPRGTCCEAHR